MAKEDKKVFSSIFMLICLLIGYVVYVYLSAPTLTKTLYSRNSTVLTNIYALNVTAPSVNDSDVALTYEGADSNIHLIGKSAIKLSDISSRIVSLPNGTWTFIINCYSNETNKASILVDIVILNSDGSQKTILAGNVSETSLLTEGNQTKTVNYNFRNRYSVSDSNEYLAIYWKVNKTDTTPLKVKVYSGTPSEPTRISLPVTVNTLSPIVSTTLMLAIVLAALIVIYNALPSSSKRGE